MKFPLIWRSTHEKITVGLIKDLTELRQKNGELTRALIKAQRNDSPKDKKTGKFIKKKK
jgi:hypothetical protein